MLKYDIRTGVKKIKTKTFMVISGVTLGVAGLAMAVAMPLAAKAVGTTWQLNAPSTLTFVCGGIPYAHTLNTVSENQTTGDFTGTGSYNPDHSYTWDAAGNITDNNFNMTVTYTGTSAGSVYNLVGTIAPDGSISGTSDSNCQTFSMPAGTAVQNSTIIVTPTNTQGWSTDDTRPGGAVNFVSDSTAPGNPHLGALQLTTDATTTAKAQYMHDANVALSNVTSLSYYTKQVSGPAFADASYQLPICAGGFNTPVTATNPSGCTDFTTLVYEPYQHGVITLNSWQSWDVGSSTFWSSRTFTDGSCALVGNQGPPTYTLASVNTICPNAVVVGFGVNIGSNNPSYNVEADLVNFNGTTYNFEPYVVATDKDACKDGGWQNVTDNNGNAFKNQGQCVSWTEHYVNGHGTPALSKPSH